MYLYLSKSICIYLYFYTIFRRKFRCFRGKMTEEETMNFDLSAKKKKKKKKTPFDLDAALDGGQDNEEKVGRRTRHGSEGRTADRSTKRR